jgi:hypothetical protein
MYLRSWFNEHGLTLTYLPEEVEEERHTIDTCAAALAAWQWKERKSTWLLPAIPSFILMIFAA